MHIPKSLSNSAQIIQDFFNDKGIQIIVVELTESTRTAQDAANAIGCKIEQIVKSLIFRTKDKNEPILILASGPNRINESLIEKFIGEKIEKADANFTREVTGFAIGGIPPVGHKQIIKTFIDEDLTKHNEIWAAAGTPNAVFKLTIKDLLDLSKAKILKVH